MKMRKILASLAAAAVACSAMAISAFADFTYIGGDKTEWDFNDAATLFADDTKVIVVNYTDANDGWGDLGFGFSADGGWKSYSFNNPAGTEVDMEFTVAEIVEACGIEDVSTITFGKIEGYNGCVINNVSVKAAEEEAPEGSGELNITGTPVLEQTGEGSNDVANCVQVQTTATGGEYEFKAEDKVFVKITPDEGADISTWEIALNGFDAAWGGWKAASAPAGTLVFESTIQAVMDANGITDIAQFGGFILQVWNTNAGETFTWELTVTTEAEDEPVEDEPVEDEPVEDEPVEDEPTDDNPTTGATAGLALAAVALAGAAVVATKKNK